MHLEAKSAFEIDEQIWGKVELVLTQRRLDANLLSKLPSRLKGKLSLIWRKNSYTQICCQILPLRLSSSTFPQICSSISTADFASKQIKLNFPSHMLGNFHCRFASKRFCVKPSSTFPQICSGILTVDFDSLKHAKKSLYRAPTAVFCKDWSRSLWRGHSSINQSQM